ncbi:PaaI family thioesterase [Paludibacterium yongneupense]|uniref:PaaI family thioesterase n=1 Tax=Paludibacterium yongneupense TaxID=400061 RepID=UPI0003F4F382|nr:PaaI family thioesterase [Paludibacterium yongneupense]
MSGGANPGLLESLSRLFVSLPHSLALGLSYLGCDAERRVTLRVDWREDLVGNPVTGVIHGGVITSLVDTSSATAVAAQLDRAEAIATLDLRIDYLKAAQPGRAIFCRAECYRLAHQVAFTRAVCFHDTPDDPIAHGVATFMRESSPMPMSGEEAVR